MQILFKTKEIIKNIKNVKNPNFATIKGSIIKALPKACHIQKSKVLLIDFSLKGYIIQSKKFKFYLF